MKGTKKIKITFEITFETKIISKKGGQIPPLPPLCARRACPEWLTSSNASLSIHGTTTPKNLVDFVKRFANKTALKLLAQFIFADAKTVNAFFGVVVPWMERSRTTGAHPPPPSKEGGIEPTPYPLPMGGERQRQLQKRTAKAKSELQKRTAKAKGKG